MDGNLFIFPVSQKMIQKCTDHLYIKRCNLYMLGFNSLHCFILWSSQKRQPLNMLVMRKCVVLFMILIFALICAAVLESKDLEMQSDWNEMATLP